MSVVEIFSRPAGPALSALRTSVGGASVSSRRTLLIVIDLALIALGVIIAYQTHVDRAFAGPHAEVLPVWVGLLLPPLWVATLAVFGTYSLTLVRSGIEEMRRTGMASFFLAGTLAIICYLLDIHLSRAFFVWFFVTGVPVLMLARLGRRRIVNWMCEQGHLRLPVLVAGAPAHIDDVARVLRRERWLGYEIVGALSESPLTETGLGVPIVGRIESTVDLVHRSRPHAVIFTDGSFPDSQHFKQVVRQLEGHDTLLVVTPSLTDTCAGRLASHPVAGLPMMHVAPPHAQRAARWGKRLFDIVGAGLLLLLALPIIGVAALAVKLEDRGPAFFQQTRVGRGRRAFGCYKIRSMVLDAEARKSELQARNEGAGVLFKIARDPRITRVGHWIRRFSIDELPQLWNVVKGDMSLVGPRPALPVEVDQYDGDTARRLDVRPGLTGLWQVSGRSDLPWEEAVRLDTYYVDNWSMIQDVVILARTARAVLSSRGAY